MKNAESTIRTTKYMNISVRPDMEHVLRRLGYRKSVEMSPEFQKELTSYYNKAAGMITARGVSGRTGVMSAGKGKITLLSAGDIVSQNLSKLLANSSEALLMAATLGDRPVSAVGDALKSGEAAWGMVLDAYASEAVDMALDFIMGVVAKEIRRSGAILTRHRFSPGYGDLDIRYQKLLYDALRLHELGIRINDKYMLDPEKSVIAIAGVEKT